MTGRYWSGIVTVAGAFLALATSCSLSTTPAERGPRLTDAELLAALDPGFEGMQRITRLRDRGETAEALDRQVYPDGAQIELSPGYHNVSLRNFLGPLESARAYGVALPNGYVAKLERMFAYKRTNWATELYAFWIEQAANRDCHQDCSACRQKMLC